MGAETVGDRLQPLIETSARRLALAQHVALSKWDSGAEVEDPIREAQVVSSAIKAAQVIGVDPASVNQFFRAQIEANKIIQYSLLSDWRRAGKAPAHQPIDLKATVRPELDLIQTKLISELSDTASIRASRTCQTDVASAIGLYLSTKGSDLSALEKIALDRAMAEACTHP